MRVRMVGATDVGRRRKSNQDSLFYDEPSGLGIIADGIGGRSGGEIASNMVVNGLRKALMNGESLRQDEAPSFLVNAIDRQNLEILERGARDVELAGMGTTLNCLLFVGERLYIAHVGDSRTYLYYKRHLFQLTLDHSVGTFIERGWLPRSAVQPGAKEGALVKALGLADRCEVDLYEIRLKPGQLFITCSDGLSGMVEDQHLARIIAENIEKFDNLPKILIDAANHKGGKDNVTVLCSMVAA